MRRNSWLVGCLLLSSLATSCGSSDAGASRVEPVHVARTNGSAITLSTDERIAVATNRTAGVVSVFSVEPVAGATPRLILKKELDTGVGSEPWAAIVGPDDDTAYVVLRRTHQVVPVRDLHGTPRLADDEAVTVDAEPTSIAITPSGRVLFVACWGEGTIDTLSTSPFKKLKGVIDLNRVLAEQGNLGTVSPRPGLAHPYALAVTDSGDDDDSNEKLYATEFFSQPLAAAEQADLDTSRQGLVYVVNLDKGQISPSAPVIPINAVPDTGIADGEGKRTGCYPNQLNAAALDHGRLYLTSMCTSPRGPLGPTKDMAGMVTSTENFKTLVHPAVFVVDTSNDFEMPEQGRILTHELDVAYATDQAPKIRMPLSPSGLAFGSQAREGGVSSAYVSSLGADAVFRLDYDRLGTLQSIGDPGQRYATMHFGTAMPVGVAASLASTPPFVLALNDGEQNVGVIDVTTNAVTPVYATSEDSRAFALRSSAETLGHHLFATGLDVWSYKGQARSSCESCHPGGGSDGVVWSFSRGPRRTLSTANTFEKTREPARREQRLLLWSGNGDEVHDVEGIVRNVSGGVGGILWRYVNGQSDNDCRLLYDAAKPPAPGKGVCAMGSSAPQSAKHTSTLRNALNGSLAATSQGVACDEDQELCNTSTVGDWDNINAFIRSLRAPTAPVSLTSDAVAAGHELFVQGKCANCHGGPGWTVSRLFYQPGDEANGALPYPKPTTLPTLGWLRTATYSAGVLAALNPPAANGPTTFRAPLPNPATSDELLTYLYDSDKANDDQLLCALRDVGTFRPEGVMIPGGNPVSELRANNNPAQGALGMNVPSLFGMAVGAPFFHAGNARTLEELFDSDTFAKHHQALAPGFLSRDADPIAYVNEVRRLIAYLLSIDETTPLEPIEPGYDLCVH